MEKFSTNEKLISVNQARKIMLRNAKRIIQTETIGINQCEGRVLAENIYAKFNIPEHHNAAVDGYAFTHKSLGKKTKKFKIIGESFPGKPFFGRLNEKEAIRIYTGAYIFDFKDSKIDTVCMEENCKISGNHIQIIRIPKKGSNIRLRGEDIKKNKVAFKKGKKIRSVDLSQLSSLGLKKIKVLKKLKVGVFSSGNELANSKKKEFDIYDSNKISLLNLIKRIGCDSFDLGIIKDSTLDTQKKILKQTFDVDILVTSGGISKSKTDKIQSFLHEKGKIFVWRLSIKPGRPFAFGEIKNIPFIGLPGNPVAAIITFFMLVIEYVKKMSGCTDNQIIERVLPSNFAMKKKKGRREWLRGLIIRKKNQYFLDKFPTTGSGIISSISKSEGIIEIEEEKEYIKKGTLLKFFRYEDLLSWKFCILQN